MKEEINLEQELLDSENFNKNHKKILKNSEKSLFEIWLIGAVYTRWKRLKSIREKEAVNCSSNFQEQINKILKRINEFLIPKQSSKKPKTTSNQKNKKLLFISAHFRKKFESLLEEYFLIKYMVH